MARTRRKMQESLPLVHAVVELRDARAPESSRNPVLGELIGAKPHMILLNKCDLADAAATACFVRALPHALAVDCRSGKGLNRFPAFARECLTDVIKFNEAKGMKGKPLRLMVVGIPNVGKSSFINRLAHSGRAEIADRPGVTRHNQWYVIGQVGGVRIELLDTPGVLWPKFESPEVGEKLAFLGSIKDEIIDVETLALRLLEFLRENYAERLHGRYQLKGLEQTPAELLEQLARRRGMLLPGNQPDNHRAAVVLLDELRAGKLGKITLDPLPDFG
jgi:ribosome biogenesis GTPase A